jgi:hypothetical protein
VGRVGNGFFVSCWSCWLGWEYWFAGVEASGGADS